MNHLFATLFLLAFILLLVGLISPSAALFWGKTKTRKAVIILYGPILICSLALAAYFRLQPAPSDATAPISAATEVAQQQPVYSLGSDITAFEKKYPKAPVSREWITQNLYENRFLMAVGGNRLVPEKVDSIRVVLEKRTADWQLTTPLEYPVKDIATINQIITELAPPDSQLKREKAYQITSSGTTHVHYKIYRQYESNWLEENFSANPSLKISNKKAFTVIINKLPEGYQSVTLDVNPIEWEDIDRGVHGPDGWQEIESPKT